MTDQDESHQPEPRSEGQEAVQRGLALFREKRYREAAEVLAPVAAGHPTEEALVHLGLALGQLQDLDACRETLVEAARRFPGSADVRAYLGTTLRSQGRLEEALASYREALAIDEGHIGALWGLGLGLGMAGRPEEGRLELQQAIRLAPGFPPPHFHLAVLSLALGDREEARRRWTVLRTLAPSYAERLGQILADEPET